MSRLFYQLQDIAIAASSLMRRFHLSLLSPLMLTLIDTLRLSFSVFAALSYCRHCLARRLIAMLLMPILLHAIRDYARVAAP